MQIVQKSIGTFDLPAVIVWWDSKIIGLDATKRLGRSLGIDAWCDTGQINNRFATLMLFLKRSCSLWIAVRLPDRNCLLSLGKALRDAVLDLAQRNTFNLLVPVSRCDRLNVRSWLLYTSLTHVHEQAQVVLNLSTNLQSRRVTVLNTERFNLFGTQHNLAIMLLKERICTSRIVFMISSTERHFRGRGGLDNEWRSVIPAENVLPDRRDCRTRKHFERVRLLLERG